MKAFSEEVTGLELRPIILWDPETQPADVCAYIEHTISGSVDKDTLVWNINQDPSFLSVPGVSRVCQLAVRDLEYGGVGVWLADLQSA